jgi:hypothetical protein
MGAWLGFVAGVLVYVYGFVDRSAGDAIAFLALLAFGALHVLAAAVIARPRVVVLPVLAVVLAFPAGDHPVGGPELPVAAQILYLELIGTPLVVGAAVVAARRERARGRDGSGPAAWT